MPGPKAESPRKPGNRPDPNGDARKPNAKVARRLAARQGDIPKKQGDFLKYSYRTPGSQNRKK